MNFISIFRMQTKLDASIEKKHNVNPQDIIEEKILALIVEVTEFANEYAPFKYWKKNKKIDKDKLIEEFVDGIHFFVSLGLFLKIDPKIKAIITSENKTIQLLNTIEEIINLRKNFNGKNLQKAFGIYMGNAELLNISESEINQYYLQKNKINFQRIKNNY